ncbi:MAG: hypothetical protein EBT13_11435 [Rhodobacteraceae bacterium]|nr:hypothetical protein [Paracoccaceae bacterium]
MAIDGGITYDGELTIWDLGSRTSAGFFTSNEAVALNWAIQVTVTGLVGGGKQAVFDFDGSLDGTNWGHLTVLTKHPGANTITDDSTVMYYVQSQPNRFIRVHLITLTSTNTATVSVKLGAI